VSRTTARETLGAVGTGVAEGCAGSGCQGCFAIVFVVLFTIGWIGAHRHQIVKAGALGVGAASVAVLAREGLRRLRRRRVQREEKDGPVPLAQIAPGLVHTAGLVGIHAPPIEVPLEGAPCVFYRIVLTDDGIPLFETRSADAIVLEDGAGATLTVKLDGATWKLDRAFEAASTRDVPNVALDKYLAERGLSARGAVYARVEWIAPHELVFARGHVARVGEDVQDYRTSEHATFVMTGATIALHEAPQDPN